MPSISANDPIQSGKKTAVIRMFSDNVLCRVKEGTTVLLPSGEELKLSGGVYKNEELDELTFPNSILKLRPRLISHQRASYKGVKILNGPFQS